jgi:hypothetical protein
MAEQVANVRPDAVVVKLSGIDGNSHTVILLNVRLHLKIW